MRFYEYENISSWKNKIGSMTQLAGIKRYVFSDGKMKGVEAIDVRTGSGLEFTVLPGRGMDIAWVSYRGLPLNYMSKTGIVSPSYYECEGMGWLRSFFGGMLTTCGLGNAGGPSDEYHDVIGMQHYGLHGRISNCCAEQVSTYEDWADETYKMRLSGLMREAVLHDELLTLRREISTSFGRKGFTLHDVVCNASQKPQPVMLLYHCNAGYPLLDKGSRLLTASQTVLPVNEQAETDIASYASYTEPIPGQTERCYTHDFLSDEHGTVYAAIVNDELETGLALRYSRFELPYFNQWKMMNEREYVLGLEPGNCSPVGRKKALAQGQCDILAPDTCKSITINFTVLDGKDEIAAFEQKLNVLKIQNRQT